MTSSDIQLPQAVQGQDSLVFNYRFTNTGQAAAAGISVTDSFSVSGNVTSQWVFLGQSGFVSSLASGDTATLTRYYQVKSNATAATHRHHIRLSGNDFNDPSQSTDTLALLSDSVRVVTPAKLIIDSLSVFVDGLITDTANVGDTLLLEIRVSNTGQSTVINVDSVAGFPTVTGTGQVTLLQGRTITQDTLATGESAFLRWIYRANNTGTGVANFAVQVSGTDSTFTQFTTTSSVADTFVVIRPAEADTVLSTTNLATVTIANQPVDGFVNLNVKVRDEFGNRVPDEPLQFIVTSGDGVFDDGSGVQDTTVTTNEEGTALLEFYTSTNDTTNTVAVRLLSTSDDSVIYTVITVPQSIAKMTVTVDTNWIAGISENIEVRAFDQYDNLAVNSGANITLEAISASSMVFAANPLPLAGGIVNFSARDTVARSFMQIRAEASTTGTQKLSQALNVKHTTAARFAEGDTLSLNNIIVGNSVTLTSTVVDTFGNPVLDTTVVFEVTEKQFTGGFNGIPLDTIENVNTTVSGEADVAYTTGDTIGVNEIFATTATMSDTIRYLVTTVAIDANASFVSNSLEPDTVTESQTAAFTLKIQNTGTVDIKLAPDSTSIVFVNGVDTVEAFLDTSINRTIAAGVVSELSFKSVLVDLPAGLYSTTVNEAFVILTGTVLDTSTSVTSPFNKVVQISDTLTVQTPANLVLASSDIQLPQAVQGQDSLVFNYRFTNTGQAAAAGISLTDSFSVSGDVTSQWVFLGQSGFVSSLASGDTATLTRYYQVKSNATTGTHRHHIRLSGNDFNDPSQSTDTLALLSDSVRVVTPAKLVIDSLSVLVDGLLTDTARVGDTLLLQVKVTNTGQSTAINVDSVAGFPNVEGTGQVTLLQGRTITQDTLATGESAFLRWTYRANNTGTGVANFSMQVSGTDSTVTQFTTTSSVADTFVVIRPAEADTVLSTSNLATVTIANQPVDGFVNLNVKVRDEFGNRVPDEPLQFIVTSGDGVFDEGSGVQDTTVTTNEEGTALLEFFTSTNDTTNTVAVRLLSTSDDSVIYTVITVPQSIAKMTVTVNTNWIAGISENIEVRAFDQYDNLAVNSGANITLEAISASSLVFAANPLPLAGGIVNFSGRDTVARSFMQIRAEASTTGTQKLSQALNVKHTTAARFAEADTVFINGIINGNNVTLTTTVVDTFNNPVLDTVVTYTVTQANGDGAISGSNTDSTDASGKAMVIYTSSSTPGLNIVQATNSIIADTVQFKLDVIEIDANASYVANSLIPDVVTENQTTKFEVSLQNTGSIDVTLNPDSTEIVFANATDTVRSFLDSAINRTVTAGGISQLTFKSVLVDLPADLYSTAVNSAYLVIKGTILDTAGGISEPFSDIIQILDTLTVQTPANLVLTSSDIQLPQAVQGQDSLVFNYRFTNTGQAAAAGISVTDSFSVSGNVTSQWVFLGQSGFVSSLASGDTATLTRYYQVKSNATAATHRHHIRLSGNDFNDPSQSTDTLALLSDSVRVVTPAKLIIDSLSVFVDGLITDTANVGDTLLLEIRVSNTGQSTVINVDSVAGFPTVTGTGQVTLLQGRTITQDTLATGESAFLRWIYRANNTGTGVANFAVQVSGTDSTFTQFTTTSSVADTFVVIRPAEADTVLSTTNLATVTIANQPVDGFVNLNVKVRDEFGNRVPDEPLQFIVTSGDGVFDDGSGVQDTTVTTNEEGTALLEFYTSTNDTTNTVAVRLLSTSDDSVIYTVITVPQSIAKMTVTVDTNWIAGISENIEVRAFDQYDNLAVNSGANITLEAISASSLVFAANPLPLAGGIVNFSARDTVARSFMQIRAEASTTGTQKLSQALNVKHTTAARFAEGDTLSLNNIIVGNSVTLTSTVVDTFGNPVLDTTVVFEVTEKQFTGGFNGIPLDTIENVNTTVSGEADVAYTTGDTIGVNEIFATTATMSDTIRYLVTTVAIDANASFVSNSLEPDTVTESQTAAFTLKIQNTGTVDIKLAPDSTSIVFVNGVDTVEAFLDTSINRTIAAGVVSELSFKSVLVDLPAGLYSTTVNEAFVILTGTVLDTSTSVTSPFNKVVQISDTLTVQTPANLVLASSDIQLPQAVQGQDSLVFNYRFTNTGQAAAAGISLTDSFSVSGDVTSQWVFLGQSGFVSSLASGDTATLTRYYQVKSNATTGTHRHHIRLSGNDFNDPSQSTDTLALLSDSVRVVTPAKLVIDSLSVLVDGLLTDTARVGDTLLLQVKVTNTGQSTAINVDSVAGFPNVEGTGQVTLLQGRTITQDTLATGESAFLRWTYRANNTGTGVANFSMQVSGTDSTVTQFTTTSSVADTFVVIRPAEADTVLSTSNLATVTIANQPVDGFVNLNVKVRDEFGNRVPDEPLQFIVTSGDGVFDEGSGVQDTTVTTNEEGTALLEFFTSTNDTTNTVAVRLLSTSDDSVIYTVITVPQSIAKMTVTVNTNWIAGISENIEVRALTSMIIWR